MKNAAAHPGASATALVVRVLQDLVTRERFDTYADLAEALKARCARLKIPYHAGLISDAIDQLERGGQTPLIARPVVRRTARIERDDGPPPITRDEARDILAALQISLPLRTMAPATWRDPERVRQDYEAARARVYEMGVELSLEDFLR